METRTVFPLNNRMKRNDLFLEEIKDPDSFRDLKLHSEKIFQKLWENEDDEIWASYL